MSKLSPGDKQKLLRMQLEDYELSENPSEEILKSMRSVFSPYKNLGGFYNQNWSRIEPILKSKSWLKWLSDTERENLYYHQLRQEHPLYIHNEHEFSLLLQAQKRLMQTAAWQDKDVPLSCWIYHQLAFQPTPAFPLTFEDWQLIGLWLHQADKYTSIPKMVIKADKFKIYSDNQSLCEHIATIFQRNAYFADWDTEYLSLNPIWVGAVFLMFLSPIWHNAAERDLRQIGNQDMLEIWQIFLRHSV